MRKSRRCQAKSGTPAVGDAWCLVRGKESAAEGKYVLDAIPRTIEAVADPI